MDRPTPTIERTTLLLLLAALTTFAACGSSRESATEDAERKFESDLKHYESDFRPSDYNPEVEQILQEDKASTTLEGDVPRQQVPVEAPEEASGFRVQLFSSTSIDAANLTIDEVQTLFPDEWFYVVYDPPTYKIRGGNFLTRFEADRFAKQLIQAGYSDSWVVPDRVIKNPPPRPPAQQPLNSGQK